MPAAAPDIVEAAATAEAHYRRMWRLRQMNEVQLRTLLAGDAAEAAPWVESAARYGVPEAQLRLGRMCLEGAGVPHDPVQALAWFSRAAGANSNAAGPGEAMNMVGRCYENGWGAAEDLVVAAGWYRLSAEAGHDWGEYNYANMLFDGRGVARDLEQAVAWYRRAAGQGHTRAMNLLARCCEEAWGTPRDPAAAALWYRRAAEGGYFRSQFNHATLLAASGSLEEAVAWFERACDAAPPESLAGMTEALICRPEPPLVELGRRFAATSVATPTV